MQNLIKPLDFSKYLFRASSAGKLCGKGKGKTPLQKYEDCLSSIISLKSAIEKAKDKNGKTCISNIAKLKEKEAILPELEANKDKQFLSETAISYLIQIYAEVRYGIKKNIYGKYLESGVAREPESIALAARVDDELYESYKLWCEKNGKQYRQFNEFVEGECDILYPVFEPEVVIDVKSSWDPFTFQPHTLELIEHEGDDEIENIIYKYQGVVYCVLYKAKKFKLKYCLVDMPDELIEDEIKRIVYSFGKKMEDSPACQDAITEFIRKTKFYHIPEEARVITFEFDYNEEDYNFLCGQIEIARQWLNAYAISEWERENRTKWDMMTEDNALNIIAKKEYEECEAGITKNLVDLYDLKHEPILEKLKNIILDLPEDKFEKSTPDLCPNCKSIKYISYNEFGDKMCEECGYDSDTGAIIYNKEEQIQVVQQTLEPEPISDSTQLSTPTPEPIITPELTPVLDEIMIQISLCKDRDGCVDLYTNKGAAFWSEPENKKYYDSLTEKRKSFTVPISEPKKESTHKDKKIDTPPPLPPQQKAIFTIPVNNPQSGDAEKISVLEKEMISYTTVQQFMDTYRNNKELIDRNLDFRGKYNEAGKALSLAIAKKKRDEVQKNITG